MKLKPCPFCGSEATVKRTGNEHCKKMQVKIECTRSGCMSYQQASTLTKMMAKSWEWLEDKATVAWNTRPIEDEQDDQIRQLQEKSDCFVEVWGYLEKEHKYIAYEIQQMFVN